jgi:hypothetical protein
MMCVGSWCVLILRTIFDILDRSYNCQHVLTCCHGNQDDCAGKYMFKHRQHISKTMVIHWQKHCQTSSTHKDKHLKQTHWRTWLKTSVRHHQRPSSTIINNFVKSSFKSIVNKPRQQQFIQTSLAAAGS